MNKVITVLNKHDRENKYTLSFGKIYKNGREISFDTLIMMVYENGRYDGRYRDKGFQNVFGTRHS